MRRLEDGPTWATVTQLVTEGRSLREISEATGHAPGSLMTALARNGLRTSAQSGPRSRRRPDDPEVAAAAEELVRARQRSHLRGRIWRLERDLEDARAQLAAL